MGKSVPPSLSLAARRAAAGVLSLLVLGLIGAFTALTATNPKVPHPWGDIRLMHYSTNANTTMAHFRFRNLFEWPVYIEVGVEVHNERGWEMGRGYSLFVPIEKAVASKDGQNFVVPMPSDCKEWRVLVRAAKADLTSTDTRREKIKHWLDTHGAAFLGRRIKVEDANGHILPGPDMRWDKPGRLPTPYYGSSLRLPAWEPFPSRATRATCPRR